MPHIKDESRETLKELRDDKLMEEYYRVMAERGKDAASMKRMVFYEEAAKPFFITPGHAKNIILKRIRNRPKKNVRAQ